MALKLWQCEKCKRQFTTEEAAIDCERSHNDVYGCVSFYHFGDQYPHRVKLSFLDGHTRDYVLVQVGLDQEWRERNIEVRQAQKNRSRGKG